MGVPKFYRWLSERYPLINQMISNSSQLPEIDNFYLDMNGIIHACTHPNDSDVSLKLTLRDMILAIFRYIDRCVSGIVKPKKLLFLAIDGCAPRAKLNQQRSRRFRAGQERSENMLKARQRGEAVDESSLFDSNCITPGTEFMEIVDTHLRWFIRKKMKEDPVWRDVEVIYSGHDVPGEGEHKIIQYIRDARAAPDYQPNQRHCLYGQDADLIMLGLATHEPHFTLLREVIDFGGGKRFMGQRETVMKQTRDPKFQLLHLSVLREYIEADFASRHTGEPLDRERLVDDFVFLTFLVGNDFLPHLPTLDIGENAFDVIFGLYQDLQQKVVRYIVHNGEIGDFDRLEELMTAIGVREAEILRNREVETKEFNAKRRKYRDGRHLVPSLEQEEEEDLEMQRALDMAIAEAEAEGRGGVEDGVEFKSGQTSVSSSMPPTPPATPLEGMADDKQWVDVAAVSRGLKQSLLKNVVDQNEGPDAVEAEGGKREPKNYRGMYYYQKFKVTPGTARMEAFMQELSAEYLKGLMWCLAYYFKGCVSWSWYFPYYYGPMLGDMKNLSTMATRIAFELGQPFQPFQQLLGCLPPSSKNLLPMPYQWIMTSPLSPVLEYYPLDFEVDMDGKKNPWEAVVILPFIDSDRLKAAEAEHCPPCTLTPPEARRNTFGQIMHYSFDPQCMDTVPSCNPAIGLLDIVHCHTRVRAVPANLSPGRSFVPALIPGTVKTCAGFPSLGLIPIENVNLEAIKLNVFGSDSKYKSLVISVLSRQFSPESIDMQLLLGRSVFVNYPLIHEAKVVGVSCESRSYKQRTRRLGSIEETFVEERKHDDMMKMQWRKESVQEEGKYLRGRGVAGTGGIAIGPVVIRLRVVPLQGMRTDRLTGIRKKVFGEDEADVPIQMALWTSPVADSRFDEQDEVMAVESLYPHGCKVVATEGPFIGCSGVVVGPHGPVEKGATSRSHLVAEKKTKKEQSRAVDIEFTVNPSEPPFGYALNISIMDDYLSGREASRRLGITTSILGMITGSLVLDPVRQDIGLNLKKNGEFQLLEYARTVVSPGPAPAGLPEPGKVGNSKASVWASGDSVQIVGSLDSSGGTATGGSGGADGFNSSGGFASWEYSEKAIELIEEYRRQFPVIFIKLQQMSHQKKYTTKDVFGEITGTGEAEVDRVLTWMKNQPFFHLARSPLTTSCISRDGIRAIERAVDVRTSALASEEGISGQRPQKIIKKKVPLQTIFKECMFGPYDAPLQGLNDHYGPPELGDRVVNLVASAVPFGLKGTVIAIHSTTAFVEVLFDEEFAGGKSLQGLCSPFRGALVSWTSVLKVSRNTLPGSQQQRKSNSQAAGYPPGSAAATHVKGQLPPLKKRGKGSSTNGSEGVSPDIRSDGSNVTKIEACPATATAASTPCPRPPKTATSSMTSAPKEMKNITGILKRNLQHQPPKPESQTKPPSTAEESVSSARRPTEAIAKSADITELPKPKPSAREQDRPPNDEKHDAVAPSESRGKQHTSAGVKNVTALFKKELNISSPPTAPENPTASQMTPALPCASESFVADMPPPLPPTVAPAPAATKSPQQAKESLTSKLAKVKAQMKATRAAAASSSAIPVATTVAASPHVGKCTGSTQSPGSEKITAHSATEAKGGDAHTPKSTAVASSESVVPAPAATVAPKKAAMLVPSRVIAKKHISSTASKK